MVIVMRKFLVVVWLTATLMVSLSSCNKEKVTVDDMILGTWTLTSNPSCTWTFLRESGSNITYGVEWDGKAFIFVDSFSYPITSYYHIDNNTLKLFSRENSYQVGHNYLADSDISGPYIEDSFLSIDNISKDILQLSGNIRIYEMIRLDDHTFTRDNNNVVVPIFYEFRKSN